MYSRRIPLKYIAITQSSLHHPPSTTSLNVRCTEDECSQAQRSYKPSAPHPPESLAQLLQLHPLQIPNTSLQQTNLRPRILQSPPLALLDPSLSLPGLL